MAIFSKLFNGLTLKCFASIGAGVGVAAIIVTGLVVFANANADTAIAAAPYSVDIPQDQKMLTALSDSLKQGVDLGGEATELNKIAPAAGAPLKAE